MPVDLGDGFIHGCECDGVALGCSSDWLWSPSGCGCACVRACVRACVVGGTLVSRHCRAVLAVTCSQSEPTGPPLSTAGGSQRLSCGPRTGPACCSSRGLESSQQPSGRGGVPRVKVCGMRSLWEGGGAPALSQRLPGFKPWLGHFPALWLQACPQTLWPQFPHL